MIRFDGGMNFYTYARNNSVAFRDPTGLWEGWDDVTVMATGALVGVGSQAFSDLLNGQASGFGTYLGAGVGGAISAEVSLYNPLVGGVIGSAAGNSTTQIYNQLLGEQEGFDDSSFALSVVAGTIMGASAPNSPAEKVFAGGGLKALLNHYLGRPPKARCEEGQSNHVQPPPQPSVPDVTPCTPGFCVNQPNYGLPPGGYQTTN